MKKVNWTTALWLGLVTLGLSLGTSDGLLAQTPTTADTPQSQENAPEFNALMEACKVFLSDEVLAAAGLDVAFELPAFPDFKSIQTQGLPEAVLRNRCAKLAANGQALMDAAVGEKQRYLAHLLQWGCCEQLAATLNAATNPYPWKQEKLDEIQKIRDTLREYDAQFFEKMMKNFENPDADPDQLFDGCSLFLAFLIMADYPAEKVTPYLASLNEIAPVLDANSPEMVHAQKMKMLYLIFQESLPVEKLPVIECSDDTTPAEWNALKAKEELFVLQMYSSVLSKNLDKLAKIPALRGLICEGVNDDTLQRISGLRQLKLLYLSNCETIGEYEITDAGLECLKGLTQLKSLHLKECDKITDAGLTHLKGMTQLRSLNLHSCDNITGVGLAHLRGLTQLKSLSLWGCSKITDAGMEHLKDLTQLQSLELPSYCFTNANLEHLKGMTQLRSLDLSGCDKITGVGLEHLKGLTQLQSLDLSGCDNITDAGLEHLKGMTQLQTLDLLYCDNITDAGLEHLKGLTQLKSLKLSGCGNITDAGLVHLKGLTQLKSLDLWNCKNITNAGVEKLREALPNTTIEYHH